LQRFALSTSSAAKNWTHSIMTAILIIVLLVILAALFSGWYYDPKARKAAEKTMNEMLSSEPDDRASREWW
jgi:heme/copper-type cytochrome/quinol oxidase subunit 2